MATRSRGGPPGAGSARRLRVEEARFYAGVYSSARKGSLRELRRQGCSEEKAEELFAVAVAKVMESVDPIEREFTAPQMVNFIKRACWRCFIDARRQEPNEPILSGAVEGMRDEAGGPEEIAQGREAVAIGREALQMLPERDRIVFWQRYEMSLDPEEIQRNAGISKRTYRKIIQRANSRVLDAFERIEGGRRCEEMEAKLLRRYLAGECPPEELARVEAHLVHCRACGRTEARMRGYLLDVASGLAATLSTATVAGQGSAPAWALEHVLEGAQGLGEATRAARERLRELALRLAGALPGPAGEAGAGQALGAGAVKVASVCAAGTAVTCLLAGAVPGVGGVGLLNEPAHVQAQRKRTPPARAIGRPASLIDTVPTPSPAAPKAAKASRSHSHARQSGSGAGAGAEASPSVSTAEPQSIPISPSSAVESGSRTGAEFSSPGEPVSPPRSSAPSSSGSGGGGSGVAGGYANGAESGEFGP